MAGDLLTATLLTARCPVLYAPAMHTEMWEHPATQANVALLRRRGAIVLEPAVGRLTGADSGPGRLPEPAGDLRRRGQAAGPRRPRSRGDLAGRRVVVSAGGTREEIDPVRFIGNWSTGTQGYALASTAVARGAEVTVVAANVALPDPAGAKVTRVVSAREMHDAVLAAAEAADAVVMAAAVADYRPEARSEAKIKKDGQPPEPLRLTENPDILAGLAAAEGASRARSRGRARAAPRSWSGSPPRPTPRRSRPGPSWPARGVTCSSSTRWDTGSASARRTTRRSSTAPTGRSRRSRAGPRKPSPTWYGTWSRPPE